LELLSEACLSVKPELSEKKMRLLKKIHGFAGYGSRHGQETDWQLRKYLAGELGMVGDRLADIMVNRPDSDPLREKFSFSLKTLAYLKVELTPAEIEKVPAAGFPPEDEERLLDADLLLLEKVECLNSLLDLLEAADSPDRTEEALNLFDEGLAEVDDMFQLRRQLFRERTST
jgi:hypothetical protein